MNRLLIDTHIFLWAMSGSRSLSKSAGRLLQTTPHLYVSSLSMFELKVKEAKGKIEIPTQLPQAASKWGVIFLDFTVEQLHNYHIFDPANADPFDNALLTIAEQQHLQFLTADDAIVPLQKTYSWIINGQ